MLVDPIHAASPDQVWEQGVGVIDSHRSNHFKCGVQRALLETGNPFMARLHIECFTPVRVLGGDAGWTFVGVTRLRLNTTQRKHHGAGSIGYVCTNSQFGDDIKAGRLVKFSDTGLDYGAYYIVYTKAAGKRKSVAAFREWLLEASKELRP